MQVEISLSPSFGVPVTLSASYVNPSCSDSFVGYVPKNTIEAISCCNYEMIKGYSTYRDPDTRQTTSQYIFDRYLLSCLLQERLLLPATGLLISVSFDNGNASGFSDSFIIQTSYAVGSAQVQLEDYLFINNFTSLDYGYISTDMFFADSVINSVQSQGGALTLNQLMLNSDKDVVTGKFKHLATMLKTITAQFSTQESDIRDIVAFKYDVSNIINKGTALNATAGMQYKGDILLLRPILNDNSNVFKRGSGVVGSKDLTIMDSSLFYVLSHAPNGVLRKANQQLGEFSGILNKQCNRVNLEKLDKYFASSYKVDLSKFEVAHLGDCDKIIFELFLMCLDICYMKPRKTVVLVDIDRYLRYAVTTPAQVANAVTLLQNILPSFVEFIQNSIDGSVLIFTGVDTDSFTNLSCFGSQFK